jgi:hypothetical protein
MSTIAKMSHPADMALRAGRFMKMPISTPLTAKTIATAPNTDIWKRCIAIESLARV